MNYLPKGCKGPWGFKGKRPLGYVPGMIGDTAEIEDVERLDAAIPVENQGNLSACSGFSRSAALTTDIRAKLGKSAIPDGHCIDPVTPWEVAKEIEGTDPSANDGVQTAKSILLAYQKLGIIGASLPLHQIGSDATSINLALKEQSLCFAFNCFRAFFPDYLGPFGQVQEGIEINAWDMLNGGGHLIACIGMVMQQGDGRPWVYLPESWGQQVGYRGFTTCHYDFIQPLLLEDPWCIANYDPMQDRGWEAHIVDYAWVAQQMGRYQ